MEAIRRTSAEAVHFSARMAARAGLDPTAMEAYDLLVLSGPVPAGRLAAMTGLTRSAVTSLIDRMVRADLAERRPDPADRRRVIVAPRPIPPRIADTAGPAYAAMAAASEVVMAAFSDAELALVLRFATKLNEAGAAVIAGLGETD